MRLILQSVLNRLSLHPLRGVLSVFGMALGSAAIIVVFNLSFRFQEAFAQTTESIASTIVIANANLEDDGSTSWTGQGAFTPELLETLKRDVAELTVAVPMAAGGMNFEMRVGDEYYRVRRAVPTVPEYRELYDLEMIAGSFLTERDVTEAAEVAVIGEEVARVAFGGVEQAIGGEIARVQVSGPQQRAGRTYTVSGVFRDPTYYQRMVQGIGDVLVPQSLFQRTGDVRYRAILCRVTGVSFDQIKPRLESVARSAVGDDVPVAVWQGSPNGPQSIGMLDSMEQTIRSVSTFFGALGMIALLVSAFGMFSATLVSILERTREIGLRRALGSTRIGIVSHFTVEAAIMTVIGVAVGIAIAAVFNHPIVQGVQPMFSFGPAETLVEIQSLPGIDAIVAGGGLALVVGTVLGMIPAVSAAGVSPIESLREE